MTLLVLALIGMFFGSVYAVVTYTGTQQSNTIERARYEGQISKTDWYQDNLNWISNKHVLIRGLEEFYKATGIQPYVVFEPYNSAYWNADGSANADAMDAHLETVYNNTFTDEAHFIFAYFSCEVDSKKEMEGEFRYLSGYSADTIMDSEALKMFWGFFQENYYNTSLSLESMIADTFTDTATRIMSSPTNAYDAAVAMIWVSGIVLAIFGLSKISKTVARRRREKEAYNKQILEVPLQTFGTKIDTSKIEKKYQDDKEE